MVAPDPVARKLIALGAPASSEIRNRYQVELERWTTMISQLHFMAWFSTTMELSARPKIDSMRQIRQSSSYWLSDWGFHRPKTMVSRVS